ncbi:MAG: folate-binding protein, partial [Gammaproteobacteria bacterium]|nr:folate-binding protein [Gammaproteobacteria bacterium]
MKERWKKFLLDAGAEMDNGRVLHFGNPERELRVATTGNVLSDLNHLGLISAHGADAATFLQGQLTCDIRDVNEDGSLLGASCSHKGRVLTLFRLFR